MPFGNGIDSDCVAEACEYMRLTTAHYITPVCRGIDDDHGENYGSATFVTLRGRPYLLTNEHVPRMGLGHRLAHFVGEQQLAAVITFPFVCEPAPLDAAIARILPESLANGDRQVVPTEMIDTAFSPFAGEIMFVHGYPGDFGQFWQMVGTLRARSFPFATDLIPLPDLPGLDPEMHVAVSYPVNVHRTDGSVAFTPNPGGLSGSALWDTKYVAAGVNEWVPAGARIAAIIFGYVDNPRCLLAVKIEHVRRFILETLRHEAAYFRSIEKHSIPRDALSDWLWAEQLISGIE
ncbi:hypothetical protein BH11PLA2_BH11PLA2_29120 [soil metagenome]